MLFTGFRSAAIFSGEYMRNKAFLFYPLAWGDIGKMDPLKFVI